MDRSAARHAFKDVGRFLALTVGGALALWSAIWLPTWILMHFAGWPFLDSYMTGAPLGIMFLLVCSVAVMSYRAAARRQASRGQTEEEA